MQTEFSKKNICNYSHLSVRGLQNVIYLWTPWYAVIKFEYCKYFSVLWQEYFVHEPDDKTSAMFAC
jgi:hypothetical protein